MKKLFIFLIIPVVFFNLFINCGSKTDAMGEDDKIFVFADSVDWPEYEDALKSVFGKISYMPVSEPEYLIEWHSFDDFKALERMKNIFIMGRLDSDLPVSENVKALLNDDVIAGIETGKYFYIPKKDTWALNQYTLFLVANSKDDMLQKIYDLGDLMYDDFRKTYYTRIKESMFKHGEQKDLENYLSEHFPFKMRVQHDYFVATESVADGYVWIRRFDPDRSIFVHWLDLPENFELTPEWIIETRNKMGKKIYSGDRIVTDETKSFPVKFKKYDAIRTEGTWANDSVMVGGPFRNVTFVEKILSEFIW